MASSIVNLATVVLGFAVLLCAGLEPSSLDAVLDLPGWDGALPSRWFSGHVYAGKKEGKSLFHHYILVESERNPAADPVVVWSNGGPGAASIFGLLVELGPLLLNGKSEGKLIRNEFSWSKEANLVIINGPPPVGFSYCDPPGPTGDFQSCGAWNDSLTAYHNRVAIEGILERHPRFKSNPWYFTGESYAGVYIPTLVRELIDNRSKINIKGMAVGNACMGTDVLCFGDGDYWWRAVFLRGHAQVSEASFAKFERECRKSMELSIVSENCKKMVGALEKEAGGFYEYDLYSECFYDGDFSPPSSTWMRRSLTIGGDQFCGGDAALDKWLSSPLVRRALNIHRDAVFCSGDNGAGFTYTYGEKDLRPFYKRLVKNKLMRVLVYSGDVDVSVNVFASQNWTRNLGAKEVESWRPWTLDGKKAVVGHVTTYENDFSFVTIRGSGHMVSAEKAIINLKTNGEFQVPQFKARAAYEMIHRFLTNQKLQKYDPKGKKPELDETNVEIAES